MNLLDELLAQHNISKEMLCKKGRVSKEIVEKRSLIITFLHLEGYSWAEMIEITGLSNGTIQRLSKGKKCDAVKNKLKNIGKNVGSSWKGRKREGQLERQWAKGDFESLRGRVRTEEEKLKLKKYWSSPEARRLASLRSLKYVWNNPEVKDKLLSFHRSPSNRERQSKLQTERMLNTPQKFLRGKYEKLLTTKNTSQEITVRSSYEKKAIEILENDIDVISYSYEERFEDSEGHFIPDLIVKYKTKTILIEVKSEWALSLPDDHKVKRRLKRSEKLALGNGWDFQIWSEKELFHVN
jgi:hypothetical protein